MLTIIATTLAHGYLPNSTYNYTAEKYGNTTYTSHSEVSIPYWTVHCNLLLSLINSKIEIKTNSLKLSPDVSTPRFKSTLENDKPCVNTKQVIVIKLHINFNLVDQANTVKAQ